MGKAKETNAGSGTKKGKGGGKIIFLMVVAACFVPFGLPTVIVCSGLAPTLVALFTDTDEKRSELAAVGYLNLAGVLPFLIELWQKGQTMEAASAMMRSPTTWAIMLGAAGLGHLILYIVPPIVASFVQIKQEARLKVLKQAVVELEAIWGADVASDASLSEVLRGRGVG